MTEDSEMLVWHGCVLRRAGYQGRAGLSPTLFYVFPLRTANLIINFLLLNLGTDSKFLGLFSFPSLLPAFSVPLPLRVKFSSKADFVQPSWALRISLSWKELPGHHHRGMPAPEGGPHKAQRESELSRENFRFPCRVGTPTVNSSTDCPSLQHTLQA